MALDGWEGRQLRVGDIRQEVGQAAEREPPFGLGGRRAQDARPALAAQFGRGAPDGRLADTGLAVDEEAGRAASRPLQEPVDRLELRATSDEVGDHARVVYARVQ